MAIFLAGIFALNTTASALMAYHFVRFFNRNREKTCKYVALLSFYFGATMGLMFWGYIIGLLVSAFTKDFSYLANIACVGSALSIVPCIFGILRIIGIEKRGCLVGCEKDMTNCERE